MKCKQCGKSIASDSRFCNHCGAQVVKDIPAEISRDAQRVTENIYLGKDGKYHWYYEYRLMRNPVLLFTILRTLAFCFLVVYLFMCILTISDNPWSRMWEELGQVTFVFVCLIAFVMVLGTVSYVIWAGINGWRYCVLFEMDEKGITHTQMPKQFKKAQALSTILILAGAASGNIGRVGQGMIVRGQSSMSSTWNFVKNIEILRRRNTIKVNERMFKNQVYAEDADFDFVANYIKQHVSKKCSISE